MTRYAMFFVSCIFCLQFSFAQQKTVLTTKVNPVVQADKSSLSEQVFTLQKENKELQQQIAEMKSQLSALQTQVNANYKLLDYSFGKISKENKELQQQIAENKSQLSALQTQAPVAFTVVAGAANLTDEFKPSYNYSGTYYKSVIIDNAACNGNRDAIVLATLQPSGFGYNLPTGIAVMYDPKISKWKIVINPHETNPQIMALAKPSSGSNMVAVAEYYPYRINNGDKFNVFVMK